MRMLKIRNAILLVGFALLLGGTLLCTVADRTGIVFPDWMAVNAKHSNLEGRNYTKLPDLSVEATFSGKFQDEFESYVADLIPMRDDVLLTNARMQRLSIVSMSILTGYNYWPTFFGSSYCYDADNNIVRAMPLKVKDINTKALANSIQSINSFVDAHPDFNYAMYVPGRAGVLGFDASLNLVSDAAGESYVLNAISSELDSSVSLLHWSPSSESEYAEKYYNSDHHWNIEGAYGAYCDTATHFGFGDSLVRPTETVTFEDVPFYGSAARTGLDADYKADGIVDYGFDLPDYDLWVSGSEKDEDFVNSIVRYGDGDWPSESFTNYYADYYHTDYPQLIFVNKNKDADKALLIVGDSYTNCIERLYVNRYKKVFVYDPRLAKETLSEFMERYNNEVDDVMYMMCYTNLADKRVAENLR